MFSLQSCPRRVFRLLLCCVLFSITLMSQAVLVAPTSSPVWHGAYDSTVFAFATFRTLAGNELASPKPLSAIALHATPSPVLTGTLITLTATPTDGVLLEYQFYRRLSSGWESLTGGKYLPSKICSYTPIVAGAQLFRVNAREVGSKVYVPGEVIVTICAPLHAVSLGANRSPVLVGNPVLLTATASGGASVAYQFFRRTGTSWQSLTGGKYLPANTCSFTPTVAGPQLFRVNAREVGTTQYFPGEVTVPVNLPLHAVSLGASPSPVLVGNPVLLTATASGGASVAYQFFRRTGTSWQSLSGGKYLPANTCSFAPTDAGAQLFRVNAREVGTTQYFPGEVTVPVNLPLHAVSLGANPSPVLVGNPVLLTATASGGASVAYQFFRRTGTSWQSLTGGKYLPSPTCSYTPTVAGSQLFRVNAREVGTTQYFPGEVTVLINVPPDVNPLDGAAMVWVPGGTFTMGTPYSNSDNKPLTQQVTLSGFWMYKYEVTVAQYRAFCAATNRALPTWPGHCYSWAGKSGWADSSLQQHPIISVSWHDAKAYADWAGVRLSTEAQWEYAARGVQGHNYPWGGAAKVNDWYHGWNETKSAHHYNSWDYDKSTWPVGSFPAGASWCGAQDMAGNVWEWCADWYGHYSSTPVIDPAGPVAGDSRVLRGGSWYDGYFYSTRSAYRNERYPTGGWGDVGFRCVSLSPAP